MNPHKPPGLSARSRATPAQRHGALRDRASDVRGREDALLQARASVGSGIRVDVVGARQSGRTTFLSALHDRLEEAEWHIVYVRGIASLRQHPLAALQLAGIGGTSRSGLSLGETANSLRGSLCQPHSVLLVDDWDDLDESSWGVIEAVRRTTRSPVVLSRLHGRAARHTPTGLPASTIDPPYVIDMEPLGFDVLKRILEENFEGPVEQGTFSRLYTKSGGNVGLALSIAQAARKEGIIAQRDDGLWVASRDLWSSSLTAVLESCVEGISAEAYDALEIIALAGTATVDEARLLIEWRILEQLEAHGLISFVDAGDEHLITLVPPLLVEFFRHASLSSRRIRLTELIETRLGTGRPELNKAAASDPMLTHADDALFARLVQQRARKCVLAAAATWRNTPSPRNALRYVTALIQSPSPLARATVVEVFAGTEKDSRDALSCTRLAILHAQWIAYVDNDPKLALELLTESRLMELGVHERMLDAAVVTIKITTMRVPDDFAESLEIAEELPAAVSASLVEAHLLALVTIGRFSDAVRVYLETTRIVGEERSPMAKVLHGFALLGQGAHDEALAAFGREFEEARGGLDLEGIRLFGAAIALCHIHSGERAALGPLMSTIWAVGEPTPSPPGTQLALLTVASIVAVRRGEVNLGSRFASKINELGTPDGPLPGQSAAWAQARLLSLEGDTKGASRTLWEAAEALWERGALFAATMAAMAGTEIMPDTDRVQRAREMADSIPEAVAFHAQWHYVAALASDEAEEVLKAAPALERAGRVGMALAACQRAIRLAEEVGDACTAHCAREAERGLEERHGAGRYDTARFNTTHVALSEREKEVARLAVNGLSNPEIASRLVLSVRTVESHLRRIMRKLEIGSRSELQYHADGALR